MRVKLYRAPSITDAMRLMRAELGPDALLLSTRRVGDGVELTAAVEVAEASVPVRPSPKLAPAGEPPAPSSPSSHSSQAAALAFHGASPDMRRRLAGGPLPFAISVALRFAPLPVGPGERPLVLAGPPGAGKTLSTARLATRLVMAGLQPLVITTDGQRAGATEQLAAFTRVLGLKLLMASTPAALQRAMAHRQAGAPVLVDTAGTDPFDADQSAALSALTSAIEARVALVLPAGIDPAEAADMAAAHRAMGTELLVATRLDVARRLGSVLAAAEAGLALAEAGIGPGAADGMVPFTPDLLARRLMQVPLSTALPQSECAS
jgi:flagellar biosynthesis protein FlhF